jgi:putative ABC transport system permease protein
VEGENVVSTNDDVRGASAAAGTLAADPSPRQHGTLPPLKKEDFNRAGKLGINFSVAVEALWVNRLRSLLTTLGIVIGVFAVVSMVTVIQGVSANWTDTIASLGTNMIIIAPGTGNNVSNSGLSSSGKVSVSSRVTAALPAAETTLSLTPDDVTAIAKIPDVTEVSPVLSIRAQVIYGNQNWNTRIAGVNASLQDIQNWSIAEGAWFSTSDDQGARSVAVLGQIVYQQLFAASGDDPIGKTIRINNQLFRVVGVLATKGGASGADDVVFVPFSTAMERLKTSSYVDQILLKVDDASNISAVQSNVTTLLEQRHHIIKGNADDFNLTSSQQLLATFNQILSLATALYVAIASISLTVGGVGIMNIMIVSVTERTREIGIRMSLGAQRQDIRNQFLIEALTLSLVGGVIGMLLGLLMGFGLTNLLAIPFVITSTSLVMPFAMSAGVGVIFGLYPAMRAARLDPIEALRAL